MKASEVRELSKNELQEELSAMVRELLNLRVSKAVGQLSKTHLLTKVRRDIARVKTILAEKQNDSENK
jgi:large subunit ribosomal protein L29